MNTAKTHTGGGTGKGIPKKHRGWNKKTSGVKAGRLETFADVKIACRKFLQKKIDSGEMRDWKYGIYES